MMLHHHPLPHTPPRYSLWLLCGVWVALLCCAACNTATTTDNDNELVQNALGKLKTDTIARQYVVEIPQTWTAQKLANDVIQIQSSSTVNRAVNTYLENILIYKATQKIPYTSDTIYTQIDSMTINQRVDIAALGAQYVDNFLTTYNQVKIIETGEFRVNGVVAKEYVFSYIDIAASQNELKSLVYIIPHSLTNVYVIQCTESIDNFVPMRDIFENAVNTLRFLSN